MFSPHWVIMFDSDLEGLTSKSYKDLTKETQGEHSSLKKMFNDYIDHPSNGHWVLLNLVICKVVQTQVFS